MRNLKHQWLLLAPVVFAGGLYCLSASADPTVPSGPTPPQAAESASVEGEVIMQPVLPDDEAALRSKVEAALHRPISDVALVELPFKQALAELSDVIGSDIVIDTPAVSELGLSVDDVVINLSLSNSKPTVGQFLSLLLTQVSPTLDYVIRDGVILVTSGPAAMETRTYDVSWAAKEAQAEALFPPGAMGGVWGDSPEVPVMLTQMGGMGGGGWGGMGGGGGTTEAQSSLETLVQVVRAGVVLPVDLGNGQTFRAMLFRERLIVVTTRTGHERVAELLKELERYSQAQVAVPAPSEAAPQAFVPAAP